MSNHANLQTPNRNLRNKSLKVIYTNTLLYLYGVEMEVNSQRSLKTNRAPRVQIEYEVEVNGQQRQVELPFVMGVLSDLSGDAAQELPPIAERQFTDISSENFDQRMREIGPRLDMRVKSHLKSEGQLDTPLVFNKLDDFRPDNIARQVPELNKLLEAREKLAALLSYMDGKTGAENLVTQIVQDRPLLTQIEMVGKKEQPSDSVKSKKRG
jgi:type VI secretion system protein ImpB